MGGRLLEGPTVAGRTSDWKEELGHFLKPFLDRLGHEARRQMCPLYVSGLIGPGDRKSIQAMAKRLALGECDQLHHFVAAGVWDAAPVETELLVQADRLVGGNDAVLVIDDTAIPKKGTHSVGIAAQYASALGNYKTSNCQTLVSLTLARGEVPVTLAYAAVPVSGTFPTFYRYRPKTCWPMPNGAPSVGAAARKESSRLVLLRPACGSQTDHRSGSGTRASNICPGTRLGSSANTGCRERKNTISPICRRRLTCAP
jgi:hypothetical protein